ncbi:MAG TPA: NAD(P)-dependent alcohol dehydrogenase [Acidimicrobiia bacterium]|nr:NAD(P)-dependent alcohol dehydrogenase [Acidimicrobiia bacterium]
MKAIVQDVYGSADVLELRDIDPPVIGSDEVLLQVHAAGVEPGVWHIMTGLPYLVRVMGYGLTKPKYPVRGRDVAGRVEAVGANVTRFQVGDEVFGTCEGSFAEYAAAREDRLALKPANLTFEQAAVIPISGMTALQALRDKGQVKPGQKVLIIGAGGGVGTFAIQLAKAFGAVVTGVCSTAKVDLVRSIGADHVIDYTREDFTYRSDRYDLIIDTAGNRPLSQLRGALAPDGTLVIVGGEGGGAWVGPADRIVPVALLSPFVKQRLLSLMAAERQEDLRVLSDMAEVGKFTPALDRTYPLIEAPDAVRYVGEGHARGKVVVTI